MALPPSLCSCHQCSVLRRQSLFSAYKPVSQNKGPLAISTGCLEHKRDTFPFIPHPSPLTLALKGPQGCAPKRERASGQLALPGRRPSWGQEAESSLCLRSCHLSMPHAACQLAHFFPPRPGHRNKPSQSPHGAAAGCLWGSSVSALPAAQVLGTAPEAWASPRGGRRASCEKGPASGCRTAPHVSFGPPPPRTSVLEGSPGRLGEECRLCVSLPAPCRLLPGCPTEGGRHEKIRACLGHLTLQAGFLPPAPQTLASPFCALLAPSAATLLACCLPGTPQPLPL